MTARFVPPTKGQVERVRALANRQLSAQELDEYVNAPMDAEERERTLELIHWYSRRYPTAIERLRHARRAWKRIAARMPVG